MNAKHQRKKKIIKAAGGALWIRSWTASILTFQTVSLPFSTKFKTFHDVIPISCLTEFPNVVQMAKVSRGIYSWNIFCCTFKKLEMLIVLFFHFQLVCEEVNVDRFYPVLYPKVGSSTLLRLPQLLLSPSTPHWLTNNPPPPKQK